MPTAVSVLRNCVIVLSSVLRIKRTLDGAEINKIISGLQAEKELAIEHHRRALWDRTIKTAATFKAEY
jgi:hypothetical protein